MRQIPRDTGPSSVALLLNLDTQQAPANSKAPRSFSEKSASFIRSTSSSTLPSLAIMKNFIAIAAFAAGTNALVGRSDRCCFHLSSSGGASGSVGELGDGQVRVGDNKLSTSQFCIDSSGRITDGDGRGCIITSKYILND